VSSKDKTRNKLVGSMRKTKAGIGADKSEATRANPAPSAAEPAPATKAPAAAAPARAPAAKASQAALARTAVPNADNYQSGRRVWPD